MASRFYSAFFVLMLFIYVTFLFDKCSPKKSVSRKLLKARQDEEEEEDIKSFNNTINFNSNSQAPQQQEDPEEELEEIHSIKQTPVFRVSGQCDEESCKHGVCETTNICRCKKGWAHINERPLACNYKLKKQYVAFLLETFLILGAGHFYCNRILYGFIKVAVIAAVILIDCILKSCVKSKGIKIQNVAIIISYSLYAGLILFQLFDIVMFGINKHIDGYGLPLRS